MFPDLLTDDAFRLETGRLWLRWPRMADAAAIAKYAGEKAVSQYTLRIPHPYGSEDARRFIHSCRSLNAKGDSIGLALTRKTKPGEVIGMIGAKPEGDGEIGIAYWLAAPLWGQGYMAEALDEFAALLFTVTCTQGLLGIVRTENEASRNLLLSRGFSKSGDRLLAMPVRGGVFPCEEFRLSHADWRRREESRFRRVTGHAAVTARRAAFAGGETKLSA
ncbi:MAG: GNAT family N-acetyltransferase [Beijerinckiaceae bacterium]